MLNSIRLFRRKHLHAITRHFWGVVFTCIIATAIVVQLGRQAFPLINDYRDIIAQKLSEHLGVVIYVGSIEAVWSGLKPKITLNEVVVESISGETIFSVKNATAELSLIDSIIHRGLSWRRIIFNEFNTQFIQADDGQWRINGYSGGTANDDKASAFDIDDPFDIFVFGRRVEINAVNIQLQFNSGLESIVVVPKINLENDRFFHRMTADVNLDEHDKAFTLVVEGYGDPRSQKDFSARGYLHLKNFSTERVVAAVAGSIWEGKHDARWRDEQRIDLELWFQGSSLNGLNFIGHVHSDGLPIKLEQDFILPSSLDANVAGFVHPSMGWQVDFSDVDVTWLDERAPFSSLSLFGNKKDINITTPYIDIALWRDVFIKAGLDKLPKVYDAIDTLSPAGYLKNVSVKLAEKEQGYFFANAELVEGSVKAYMGAPEIKNINGYVQASALHGAINLQTKDGFSLFLPKVYEKPMTFEQASGVVDWRLDLDNHHVYVNSDLLRVSNHDELAHGYLNLSIPFARKWGEAWMNLIIGVESTQALYHKKYVPYKVDTGLRSWLNQAIKSGRVSQGQFLYSGSVDKDPAISPTILLNGFFNNATIQFDENWPEVSQANGYFSVENIQFSGEVFSAQFAQSDINNIKVSLEYAQKTGVPSIRVLGDVDTRAEHVKKVLLNSPIKNVLSSTLTSWSLNGDVTAEIDIGVPLISPKKIDGMGSIDVEYDFNMQLNNVDLNMMDLQLPIKNISGNLVYSSKNQLVAKKLTSTVWGKPFVTSIKSDAVEKNSRRYIHVTTEGHANMTDVIEWTKRPELYFAEGEFPLTAQVKIPLSFSDNTDNDDIGVQVDFSSNLVGTRIHLPSPFSKDRKTPSFLQGRILTNTNGETYHIQLADSLDVLAVTKKQQPAAVSVLFHDVRLNSDKSKQEPVDISTRKNTLVPHVISLEGKLAHADLAEWQQVVKSYTQSQQKIISSTTAANDDNYIVAINAFANNLTIGNFEIENLHLSGRNSEDSWLFAIESPIVAGNIILPESNEAPQLDLTYLRIPSADMEPVSGEDVKHEVDNRLVNQPNSVHTQDKIENETLLDHKPSLFDTIQFRDIPELSIAVAELNLGGDDLGAWQFDLLPQADALRIENIVGNVHGLQVGLQNNPASLFWGSIDGEIFTQFKGDILAKDIADVLSGFGQEKILTSTSASFQVDTQWQGAPDELSLVDLQGDIQFAFETGSFIKGAAVGENPLLRLIALLNFDTLARRLKFDFSDLAAKGYAFDSVNGELRFDNGMLLLEKPVILESSSSKMQLAGTIDLQDEVIDAELVATLPVAGNLAVATAFVAGLPAAVGVYIVGKLFKNQVDKASSINYSITGKWSDPKMKINRIFDDSGAVEKGKNLDKRLKSKESNLDTHTNQ